MTLWRIVSTALLIQKSNRIAQSPNSTSHSNSKSSEENHLNRVARNTTSNHPYLSHSTHQSPSSQSWARMIYVLPYLGSPQRSMKAGRQKDNAYAAGHPSTKYSGAQNIHKPILLKTLLLQVIEYKSNTNTPWTINNQKTSSPHL